MQQFENIPGELRELKQWVTWKYDVHPQSGKQTKLPYNAMTGRLASVSDPATWTDFHTAMQAHQQFGYAGIGFVLTESDPYVVIDLDNKPEKPASESELAIHRYLIDKCASYTETSPSGHGQHIVVRGRLMRPGMRRGNVEVYASGRYMAFTGNKVNAYPIENAQEMLNKLSESMEPTGYVGMQIEDSDEIYTDAEIIELCEGASNGDIFLKLCQIPYADKPTMDRACQAIDPKYQSCSEADLALINYLAFWSRNNDQVRRIFRASGLGKRPKHAQNNKLIDRCIDIARQGQMTPAQLAEAERERIEIIAKLKTSGAPIAPPAPPSPTPSVETAAEPSAKAELFWPPGTLGELAQYLYSISSRPVQEIALASAFALCAGIGGRQFNTYSKSGLNQYLLIVGHTGIGKDEAQRGINNLLKQTEQQMGDAIAREYRGPGHFSSGQAVIRALDKRSAFFSVIGEFGLVMKSMNDRRGNVTIAAMHKKVLLDIYGKSGANDVLSSSQYSDNEKNTQTVHSPALTLLGETTPQTFYEGLTVDDIADGLLPRFHIIEYTGHRPDLNEVADTSCPRDLLDRFMRFAETSLRLRANNTVFTIPMTQEAAEHLGQFEKECTARIRIAQNGNDGPMTELWNRAHLKALRFASLAAAVDNPANPVVTIEMARWAQWEVERGTAPLLRKFKDEEVGTGDSAARAAVRKLIQSYLKGDTKVARKKYINVGAIPYKYLCTRVAQLKIFYEHRLGATPYLKQVIASLEEMGEIREIKPLIEYPAWKTYAKFYAIAAEFLNEGGDD